MYFRVLTYANQASSFCFFSDDMWVWCWVGIAVWMLITSPGHWCYFCDWIAVLVQYFWVFAPAAYAGLLNRQVEKPASFIHWLVVSRSTCNTSRPLSGLTKLLLPWFVRSPPPRNLRTMLVPFSGWSIGKCPWMGRWLEAVAFLLLDHLKLN